MNIENRNKKIYNVKDKIEQKKTEHPKIGEKKGVPSRRR